MEAPGPRAARPEPDHRRDAGHQRQHRPAHLPLELAKKNGVAETEPVEAITHLACYTGWPQAMAAMAVAKQVFAGTEPTK
jgi:alkylhydroperoxidase/carboxymuconolactone decarboxylase family protein YurZ